MKIPFDSHERNVIKTISKTCTGLLCTGPQSPCETSAAHILSSSSSRFPLRTEHSSSWTRRTPGKGTGRSSSSQVEQDAFPAPGQLPPASAPRHKRRFINPGRAELPDCRREMAPWGLDSEGLMVAPENFSALSQLNDSMISRHSHSQSLFTN